MNYEQLLEKLVADDDRFIIMTSENRAAIRNLPDKIGNRFIDTGITEMTQVGMAAGLALRGRIPITHALASFLTMRAFEFIRTDVGIPNLPVKLVGGFSGLLSEANGPTHQALEDVSLMRGIPNVNVFCPADEDDMVKCIESVLKSSSPYYIRFNNRKSLYKHASDFNEGSAEIIKDIGYVTILSSGVLFREALEVMHLLERNKIQTGLINLRTLKPIDEDIIVKSLNRSYLTVTIEDHFLTGGLFSIVSEIALKNNISGKVLPFGFKDKWFKPALFTDALIHEELTPLYILERILAEFDHINE
ncbi:MAG: transketolase C-terminal domain-containing protein [Candidatus Kapaibacterium sp.]